jgi:hypothetical protein
MIIVFITIIVLTIIVTVVIVVIVIIIIISIITIIIINNISKSSLPIVRDERLAKTKLTEHFHHRLHRRLVRDGDRSLLQKKRSKNIKDKK